MMQVVLPRSWREEFALAAAVRREDILHREKLARFDSHQRQITEEQKIEQKKREQEFDALEAAFAPPQRIVEFRAQLDTYDTKTVEALMENGETLAFAREKISGILDQAHQLPNGTRVFKTEDGLRVFDEHGQELRADVIAPEMIDDRKTRWEVLKAERDAERQLLQTQTQLLEYQQKLDEARLRLDKGDITEKELAQLKTKLEGDMPDAVRAKVAPDEAKKLDGAAASPAPAALPTDMDTLMQKTGLGPASPMGPG